MIKKRMLKLFLWNTLQNKITVEAVFISSCRSKNIINHLFVLMRKHEFESKALLAAFCNLNLII